VNLLLVSGSTRGASTNTAALRTALEVAPDGIDDVLRVIADANAALGG
jgi:chromate reductase, NAD(P)H dehydrogenase (quinone)